MNKQHTYIFRRFVEFYLNPADRNDRKLIMLAYRFSERTQKRPITLVKILLYPYTLRAYISSPDHIKSYIIRSIPKTIENAKYLPEGSVSRLLRAYRGINIGELFGQTHRLQRKRERDEIGGTNQNHKKKNRSIS